MKTLLESLAIFCLASAAWAQGLVNFNNNVAFATVADRLVRDQYSAPLVGENYFAQLYYTQTPAGSLTPVAAAGAPFQAPTTGTPGTWIGGMRTLGGILPGQTAFLQVRVLTSVVSQWPDPGTRVLGASAVFEYTVPLAGAPPEAFFMENFRGFSLVPEPSMLALAALGALGLLAPRGLASPWARSGKTSNQSRQPPPGRVARECGSAWPGAAALNR